MSLSRRQRSMDVPDTLDPRDLILGVFGPWDPRSECSATPTVLWHPRVRPAHLRMLWAKHQATIEAAATKAGVDPWIADRLFFVDALEA